MELFNTSAFSHLRSLRGFTLIELVVVIAIVSVLFVGVAVMFNPAAQFAKTQNAQRQHDLDEIRTAVETYYDDMGCYPSTINFGQEFSVGNKIYMTKIPEDPKCTSSGLNCYVYQTDSNSTCPQWNVLYTQLVAPLPPSVTCPLTHISNNCVPTNYQTIGVNYCVVSGNVDCGIISSVAITPVPPSINPVELNTPTPNIPSPTPTPSLCATYHACTGQGVNGCNVLDTTAQQNCTQLGGNTTCYCTACTVNGVNQCN